MIFSAFIVGLAGSFHCLGMCGPIAMALPVNGGSRTRALAGRLAYNGGRIVTYSLMGLAFGLFGQGLAIFTSQQKLSILIGVLMLVLLVLPAQLSRRLSPYHPIARLTSAIKRQFGALFARRSYSSLFLIGFLNGLLPCGMVYVALAGAVATGAAQSGMAYMALFGLGTLPLMFMASMAGQWLTPHWRLRFTKAIPVFTIVLATLFILRGLNLGIPLLSPQQVAESAIDTTSPARIECCHKK
jgi:uncharacterized protein